ncbi:Synaptotagmin-15 [Fasciolopsis buskii]|uniref:Synaptotagmin-15 n=1 Tax=Fasciolopsis buskii TaxID=27845 RepID=A0A8E0RVB3_9TREM|nr:Synaptotagmin-15 [Fasciolopsis buski]
MDSFSNRISPIINKIRTNPLVERVIGRDETIPVSPISANEEQSPQHPTTKDNGPLSGQLWDVSSRQAQNRHLQARQLGRLDPALYVSEETEDLYEISPSHLGRVWFTVNYSKANELLRVTIHKARNLRQLSVPGSSPSTAGMEHAATVNDECLVQDFRIKIFIDQAEKKYHTTSIKKQTINPNFNEQFCFQVASHSLNQQILRLNVLGIDKRKRCKLIGYATFNLALLEKQQQTDGKELRVYRDIQLDNETEAASNPQLMVALTFFPSTARLIVGLFKCHHLPLKENGMPIDVYARVVVYQGLQGKELKSKRTEPLGTRDSFDESFVFQKIPDPANVNVRITLIQHGFLNKQLAFVVLGGEMVSKGGGVTHWKAMLEHPEEQVCEWQDMQLF